MRVRGARWARACALGVVCAWAAAAQAETVVTLAFDDSTASQRQVKDMLAPHGMKATFYVITGRIGTSGNLTLEDLRALAADGHEIAAHTVTHRRLTELSLAERRREVCDSRARLEEWGLPPTSFAYPFSAMDADTRQIVIDCGFQSGRDTHGLADSCSSCPRSESIPPRDRYALRTPDTVKAFHTLADLQAVVTRAEQAGGGWLHFVFHRVEASCGSLTYCIPTTTLREFLAWLAPRRAQGTVVRTAHQVISGQTPPPDTTPPTVALVSPPSGATVQSPVTMAASAADNAGVTVVDFLVNGAVVGRDTTAPYSIVWDAGSTSGPVDMAARALDAAGNSATSPTHRVTVQPSAARLTVLSPNGGETLPAGGTGEVRWATSGTVPTVDVAYSRDGGATWSLIASAISNTGRLTWRVPSLPTEQALLRVSSATDPSISDRSDAFFRIAASSQLRAVPFGAVWRYWDRGTDPGTTWTQLSFNDAPWGEGPGQLGYGDRDEATLLRKTSPSQSSVYFRRRVHLSGRVTAASLQVLFDDGIAVWINGRLVLSRNMGRGLTHRVYASASAENARAAVSLALSPSPFVEGENLVAVMVKQVGSSSPDLSFDLQLDLEVSPSGPAP